jgi:sugar-specific transcriptional regulator TrmB
MTDTSHHEQAVELLQQLGMKEYEAKCFVALTRLPSASAKDISEISEVPRTRVYDAIRVLEAQGMVEVQHSNPQRFRAVPIQEAVSSLQQEYQSRAESLRDHLQSVEQVHPGEDDEEIHEVWALTGSRAIENRTLELLTEATDEVVLVLGLGDISDDDLEEALRNASDRGVHVVLGVPNEALQRRFESEAPDAEVFVTGLEWLQGVDSVDDTEPAISRLLLADRGNILVSTVANGSGVDHAEENAIFGRGFSNGLVVIFRRLLATGLLSSVDPGVEVDD